VIRDFLASLGERANLWLHQITSRDILAYRSAITAAGKTGRTANLSVKVVSAAFNAALRQHITDKNPCTALENLREHTEERDTFTPVQVSKLVQAAEGDWKGAILLGCYTGARLSDVANMQWSAIDWQNKTLKFTPRKTKKPLTIPLHPKLERELRKNPGIGKAPMFPSLAEKDTGGRFGLSGRFAAIMEKAGIEGKHTAASGGRILSSLSFHSLRHSFASAMANAGVAPESKNETHRPQRPGRSRRLYASRNGSLTRCGWTTTGCDAMKKRKRKLTEEQRKAAVRRALQRSAKDVLYMGKIVPNADNPRAVARYLIAELFACPSRGTRAVGRLIERRWNEQRFIGEMLIALGEYLLDGRQAFDDLDVEIADIIARHTGGSPRPTIPELICELQKRRPNLSVDDKFVDKIKKRVRRWVKPIPRQYLFPDL